MELNKLIYEVKEQLGAMSDDRFVDDRYIVNTINIFRADLLRKMLSRKPYYNTIGFQQHVPLVTNPVTKSVFPGIDIPCKIVRAASPIEALIYEGPNDTWFSVSSLNVLGDTIETISIERARDLTFEFNTVYSFLGLGMEADTIADKYYLYILAKDNLDLEQVILSGVFEDPLAVDPDLTNYPIKASDWSTIRGPVAQYIMNKPADDPINNSEPDEAKTAQPRRSEQEAQNQ